MSSPIWTLVNKSAFVMQNKSRFSNMYKSEDFSFIMTLKRAPQYYMINNVIPCLILNVVTLVTFFLPFALQASLSKCLNN